MIPFLFQSEYIVPLMAPNNGLEVDVLVVLVVVVEVLVAGVVVVVVDIIVV